MPTLNQTKTTSKKLNGANGHHANGVAGPKANALNDLGEKIFLDRYALKDAKKETVAVGDTVIVAVNVETGQREIGVVKTRDDQQLTIELRDGAVVERQLEHIDKPLETRPEQMLDRVARGIAEVEAPDKQAEWQQKFRWLLDHSIFVSGVRILTAAGTDQNLTFYNCYVIPSPHDSREGIMTTLTQMTEIMSRGGGVGINISSLRPHHAYVRGVNGRSSGAVSWGELYSFVTGLIEQGGSRRGALMLIMNVWHPDVLEFINSKRTMGRITNANISVGITDDFMAAVKADADWDLVFPDTSMPGYDNAWDGNLQAWREAGKPVVVHKTVRAREVWDSIIESAWASAEPGVFFVERYNKLSNSWYFAPILCTNPCGEQGLPAWGVCNLGALNLAKFVKDGDVDWDNLGRGVRTAIRFLDDVIDATPYFFDENKDQQLSERRVGMGTMGLAEMMIRLKIRYGSPESEQFLDKLYRFIASEAYLASADYAAEKGAFPQFEADKFLQSGFMQGMPEDVQAAIKEKGIRNVTLLTQAPTGTTGTMVNTSTGIEPFYFWSFHRKGRMGTHEERVEVYDEWLKANPDQSLPDYFVTAMDLTPEAHVRVQAAIQRWVDSSLSKTCNTPNSYTVEQTRELYELMYELGCKGGTIYRDGSRDVQVLNLKDEDKEKAEAEAKAEMEAQIEAAVNARMKTATKWRARPSTLHGRTYRKNTPIGTAYITINANGEGDSQPFEIFINVGKVGSDVAADAEGLGRLVSLLLRMPSPLSPQERVRDIVAQLRGIGSGRAQGFGKNRVMSMPDAVAQALAEHVGISSTGDLPGLPDEDESKQLPLMPKGDLCPSCGSASLLYIEGCKKCHECGFSEC
ncbi:MAG: adenosylcobalamin-dependent ribonucleoside-diphosphate reductase [Anaerolineales bacterium]|nr:adenosylcobalamin-dependent ribonucleoside-diphosphate reductase [Anaerolineales bacterium]